MYKRIKEIFAKITESDQSLVRFLIYVALYGFPLGMLSGLIFDHYGLGMRQYLLVMPIGYVIGGLHGWKVINKNTG